MKRIFLTIIGTLGFLISTSSAAEVAPVFTKETIDIGIVVNDIEKSVKFYKEALGFTEAEPFSVPAEWTKDVGITEGSKLDIRVMVVGEGEHATRVKLMQIEGKKPKTDDTKFITSETGLRYMTIFVTDIDASLARLKKAGYTSSSKGGIVRLPEGFPQNIFLLMARDPDGNMVELVGPKAASQK